MKADPLILSLGFDATSFDHLDRLRRTHFPTHLNWIPAHLTLFHHLPGDRADEVAGALAEAASARPIFDVRFAGLRKLGGGVALAVEAPDLMAVRAELAARFAEGLTPQDRQGFRPHVTIQNKVDPEQATALYEDLAQTFIPWTAKAEALLLWHYRGGPWEAVGRFAFSPSV